MMSKHWCSALCLVAMLVCGCTPTARRAELDERVQKSYAGSFPDRLYYTGSDDTYDYYVLENEMSKDQPSANRPQKFKVLRAESVEEPRMAVTEDRSKWRFAGPSTKINEYMIKNGEPKAPPPESQPDISKFHF